jgi:hypothetical protein
MKRLLYAGAVLWPAAAMLGGCYWLASYQDLTSGLGDAGADGRANVFDGTLDDGADAAADTGISGGEAGDGDSSSVIEAGPFCPPDAGPYVYCMDFDGVDASVLGLGSSLATVAVVSGTYLSPPSSLSVYLQAYTASGGYSVSFPFSPKTTRLEFEVSAPAASRWVTLLAINLEDATPTRRTLNVVISPTRAFHVQEYFGLADGGSQQHDHAEVALDGGAEGGAWHHVVLSLTVDDSTQTYLSGLTVDGQVLEDAQPLTLTWAQGRVDLGIGVQWTNGGGAQFYFDNVRADFGL